MTNTMETSQIQTWIEPFSRREVEILRLISDGMSNLEISQKLLLSPDTIKWYNKQIFGKLGAKSRTQAAKIAISYGLLDEPATGVIEEPKRTSNLPSPLTSFIGRKNEMAEIKQLLKFSRLLVLTGPGGCGKSRLAFQVAGELVTAYRDGAWLVEFDSISDPSLAANAIVKALKVNASGDANLVDVLKRYLAHKHLLLLLDNLEHLPGAYPMVSELLAASPYLTVLATSRERLHLYGEQEYPVRPFSLPGHQKNRSGEQLSDNDAVSLFIQRACSVHPGFKANTAKLDLIVRICVRLDGLPLAIELAASMVKTHPLSLLIQRLERSPDTLSSGPRDLPLRQRTLRAALDWSYNLLNEDEKRFFARLAIFRGGSTLDGVLQVCGGNLAGDPIDILSSLVEKNLVYTRLDVDSDQRFMMLETIHAYASERLAEFGEAEIIQALHADYYTHLVELSEAEIHSSKLDAWFARLSAEQGNIHAVFLWSFDGKEVEYGLRLVSALYYYWFYNGLAAEGRHWVNLALEKSTDASLLLRAGVLRCAGKISLELDERVKGRDYASKGLELYRQLGDELNVAYSLVNLGGLYCEQPDDVAEAIQLGTQGLEIFRKLEDKAGMGYTFNILGEFSRLQGAYESARQYYEESLACVVQTGERQRQAVVYNNLSFVAFHQKDYRQALKFAQQSLLIARELNNDYRQACFIATSAGPLNALGQPKRAAQVLGASHARFEALGAHYSPPDQAEFDLFQAEAKRQLGETAFQEAWQAGQVLSLEDAVELTLSKINS